MAAPAKSEYYQPDARRAGIPDDALSPEEREELEFFRKMSKMSRQAVAKEIRRLIRPAE